MRDRDGWIGGRAALAALGCIAALALAACDSGDAGVPDAAPASDRGAAERDGGGGDTAPPDAPDAAPECTPDCAGRACGADGCGGTCGACPDDEMCDLDGRCVPPPAACGDGACDADEDCATCADDCGACCGDGACQTGVGEDCATCADDCACLDPLACVDGQCVEPPGEAPEIEVFEAEPARLTAGESLLFTATVSDPDGLDDLVGGALETPDGVRYADFEADGQGAYALELSWDDLHAVEPIAFAAPVDRRFVARFSDRGGLEATATIDVRLTCDGRAACGGLCVDVQADAGHCGGCGQACDPAAACVDGRCRCGPGWFGCDDGACVDEAAVCDAVEDCGDGADERGCCFDGADCEPGAICVEDRCVAGCEAHADCPAGRQCRDGRCVDGCAGHGDCPAAEFCDPEGRCRPGCRGDDACGPEQQCVAGECLDRCDDDGACLPGRICRAERCAPGCAADQGLRGCAPDAICVDGGCVAGCRADAACDLGRICAEQRCVAGCRGDAACHGGSRCIDAACRWALTAPDDVLHIDGDLKEDTPRWVRPEDDCAERGDRPAYRYRAHPLVNLTDRPRRLRVSGTGGQGQLFIFGADFDPWRLDGCVTGAPFGTALTDVFLGPGEALTVVVSARFDGGITGDYRVTIETAPDIGDPCPAAVDGFCPPEGYCHPETATCTAIACGDGRVDGPEECEDGNLDPDDGCADCRRARLPIGTPCAADGDAPRCDWGGVCDPGGGRCASHPIAAPGGALRIEGTLADDDPTLLPITTDCVGPAQGPPRRTFDAWRVVNPTDARRAITVSAEAPDNALDTFVFDADFDPEQAAGCLSGQSGARAHTVSLEAGEARVVLAASSRLDPADAYTLVVETAPLLDDDCTAAGTDGRCPPDGFCHPDEGRCVPIVCGDGRVDGEEECDDGNPDDRDGCVECLIRPIAPGDPCRAGEPDQICDGGRCDPDGAVCVREAVVPIAAPGEAVQFGGALDADDPIWWVLDAGCVERINNRYEATYDVLRVLNPTAEPREIVVGGAVSTPHPVAWHVFSADFDPETYTGCLNGGVDFRSGSIAGERVPIGPGAQRVVVISSWRNLVPWAPPYVYSVSVETAPALGDDCSAAGTDGRCPPDGYCHPDTARCEASVCGDEQVHGLEECDDGDADPTDGCAECRIVPIAIGDACLPDEPGQTCDGGRCDAERAACVAHPIAAPGRVGRVEGALDLDAPLWVRPGSECRPLPDPPAYRYARVWLTNPDDAPRTITLTARWAGQAGATLHVFDDGFAPPAPDGCLAGGWADGPLDVALPPGATRAVVLSTQIRDRTLGDYAIEFETHPRAGDDCSAAGTDGRCPADGFCDPQTLLCAPAVCGDGRVEGPEVCDDGNALPGDGCVDCREAPIALGNPCGPEAPHTQCDGGLCDLAGGVCRAHAIPPPGDSTRIEASLDVDDPLWARPTNGCRPQAIAQSHFDILRIENPTATARTLTLRAEWPAAFGSPAGQLLVFDADFDPEALDGCLRADSGGGQVQLRDVPIGPGEQRVVVLTNVSHPLAVIPAYTLDVETQPALGDDCSAGGTDGRCPLGGDCHPETDRCAEVACGDGWIGGDEQCEDGDDDPLDGCDACRLRPIPIGAPCPADGPGAPCDGGFCDDGAICRDYAIPAPGRTVRIEGALDAAAPEWARPDLDCAPPARPWLRDHRYEVMRLRNGLDAPRRLAITATWDGGAADGVVYVFDGTFERRSADGCLAADDDFDGPGRSRVVDVAIGPGEERVVVASTYAADVEIAGFVVEVETQAEVGDDCSAAGTAGRCPLSGFCAPEVERCASAVCGDGRIDGDEVCEDGNLDPTDGCADCRLVPIAIGDACPGADPRALCDGGHCDPETGRCAAHPLPPPGGARVFEGAMSADGASTHLRLFNPLGQARVFDLALDGDRQAGWLYVFGGDFDPDDPGDRLAASSPLGATALTAVPIGPGEQRVVVIGASLPLPAYTLTVRSPPVEGGD